MVVLKNNGATKLQPYGITLDNYPEGGGRFWHDAPLNYFFSFEYYTFILEPSHSSPFKNHLKLN